MQSSEHLLRLFIIRNALFPNYQAMHSSLNVAHVCKRECYAARRNKCQKLCVRIVLLLEQRDSNV